MSRLYSLPNILTLLRMAAIPVILWLLAQNIPSSTTPLSDWPSLIIGGRLATILLILAGITDILDGWLARKWNLVSNFGKLVDPLADKLLITGVLVLLVQLGRVHWIITVLILAREMAASTLRAIAASEGLVIDAVRLGKYKQVFLMIGAGCLMASAPLPGTHSLAVGHVCLYIGTVSSYLSFSEYLWKYVKALQRSEASPS